MAHNDPMDSVAVPERLMTSVTALGPAGSRWLEDLPGILASLAADWSIAYGRPLDGGSAAYVIEAVTASGRPVIAKLALRAGVDGFAPFEQELETRPPPGGPALPRSSRPALQDALLNTVNGHGPCLVEELRSGQVRAAV